MNEFIEGDLAPMRRVLTAFLILSLLAGQVGMLGALLGRHYAQQRMHRKVAAASESPGRTAAVQHLTLSRSERQSSSSSFARIDEHEFRYRGNLYDVVHEEWRGQVWHVWVLHDREEEHYLDVLAETVGTSVLEGSTVPVHRQLVEALPPALVPTAAASAPSPLLRVQPFPRSSLADHEGPYLAVPDPPPWG